MSHTSSIKSVKITSISALRAAVEELGRSGVQIALHADATPRAYFTNQAGMGKADFVIALPQAKYDIGLYKQDDGSYEPRTDFFGGSVAGCLGATPSAPDKREQAQLGKLFQMYAIHAATEQARRKGHSVRRIVGAKGKIQLEITGASL